MLASGDSNFKYQYQPLLISILTFNDVNFGYKLFAYCDVSVTRIVDAFFQLYI